MVADRIWGFALDFFFREEILVVQKFVLPITGLWIQPPQNLADKETNILAMDSKLLGY